MACGALWTSISPGTHRRAGGSPSLPIDASDPKALQGSTTTVYVFAGGKDIAEYDNGAVGSPSREYIYLGGQLIATIQGATTIYHHRDHLSVRVSTDVNGVNIGEQGHYPYGETWYTANPVSKFIFTSYERDSESGNDYAMVRYYINRYGRIAPSALRFVGC